MHSLGGCVKWCAKSDVPRGQDVKNAIEIDTDGSAVRWIAATVACVGSVDHVADPGLNVGRGERRGADCVAGRVRGWNFAYGLWRDVGEVCDAGLN